jgi:hypothetical protein
MYDVIVRIIKDNYILCRVDWTAIFTLGILIVAWTQLRKINKTSSADFLHRFKNDFFNDKTRLLILLAEYDCLRYVKPKEEGVPYYEILLDNIKDENSKNETKRKIEKFLNDNYIIDVYEIDDLLLGHFEDMGILNKKKVLNIEMIYEAFSTYINICWENEQIQEYIKHQKEEEQNWDLYDKFKYIYNECKLFENKKKRKNKFLGLLI